MIDGTVAPRLNRLEPRTLAAIVARRLDSANTRRALAADAGVTTYEVSVDRDSGLVDVVVHARDAAATRKTAAALVALAGRSADEDQADSGVSAGERLLASVASLDDPPAARAGSRLRLLGGSLLLGLSGIVAVARLAELTRPYLWHRRGRVRERQPVWSDLAETASHPANQPDTARRAG